MFVRATSPISGHGHHDPVLAMLAPAATRVDGSALGDRPVLGLAVAGRRPGRGSAACWLLWPLHLWLVIVGHSAPLSLAPCSLLLCRFAPPVLSAPCYCRWLCLAIACEPVCGAPQPPTTLHVVRGVAVAALGSTSVASVPWPSASAGRSVAAHAHQAALPPARAHLGDPNLTAAGHER
jgi:hypothetical protein